MKKLLCSILVLGSLTSSTLVVNALPNDLGQAGGGWSESTGYFINLASISKPDSHKGWRESQTYNAGGDVRCRAVGETVWYNTYHYTTAQIEKTNGSIIESSGRQFNTGASRAESPWAYPGLLQNVEARTYWGR